MDNRLSHQPELESPGVGLGPTPPTPEIELHASTKDQATRTAVLDPELDDPMNGDVPRPTPESPAKAPATVEQQQVLVANRDAIKPLVESGQLKGRAMEAFVNGEGPASAISEAQATRAINLLNQGPSAPAPVPDNAPEGMEPPAAPGMEENSSDPASAFVNQPATPGQVKEANRLLNERLDDNKVPAVEAMKRTNETLGEWVAKGSSSVPMDENGSFDLSGLTKGQFNEVKAAAQSVSIQMRAETMDFEAMRPATANAPAKPVGQAVQEHIDADLKKLVLPEPILEAVKDPELMKMLEAARGTNISLRMHQDQYNQAHGTEYKVSIYDKAPELELAAKYTIGKAARSGVEMTPESAAADMKEAIGAGTNSQLYRNADADGIHNFARDVRIKAEPTPGAPRPPKADNAWMKEVIAPKDVDAVKAGLADPSNADKIPSLVKQKLDLGVPVEGLTKGDLAGLRKAGVVEGTNRGNSPFNGKDPVSANTLEAIKDLAVSKLQTALVAGLGVQLIQKLKDLGEGKEVGFNKFDAMELRKKDLLPK